MSRRPYARREPEWQSNPLNLIGFVGLISVSLGALILLYYFYDQDQWDSAAVATATVTSIEGESGNTRKLGLSYTLTDENGNGQGYFNNVPVNDESFANVLIGQTVEIEYLPDDPSESRLRGVSALPGVTLPGSLTLCCGGLLMLFVPTGMAISRRI
jgi:Protein of unknown function (DUF3592)